MPSERTVTLTVHNRPDYVARVLASLAQVRGIERWHLVIGLEPVSAECAALCEQVDFMPVTVLRNETCLGVRGNPYNVLKYVFDCGSALNIYVEEDTVVAPDVADLADWYAQAVDGDRLVDIRLMCLGLFFTSTDGERPDELRVSRTWSPWGLVCNRSQWQNHIEPCWWNDAHRFQPWQDWTISLSEHLMNNPDLGVLIPQVSRARNIGREGGVHSHPERHDQYNAGLVMNEAPGPFAYFINPAAEPDWRRAVMETW